MLKYDEDETAEVRETASGISSFELVSGLQVSEHFRVEILLGEGTYGKATSCT